MNTWYVMERFSVDEQSARLAIAERNRLVRSAQKELMASKAAAGGRPSIENLAFAISRAFLSVF